MRKVLIHCCRLVALIAPIPVGAQRPLENSESFRLHAAATSRYAAQVASLVNCQQLEVAPNSWPNALPLLKNIPRIDEIFIGDGKIEKGEFETSQIFEARRTKFWKDLLGENAKIIIKIPLDRNQSKYDADSQIITLQDIVVADRVDPLNGRVKNILLSQDFSEGKSYVGSNSYGASAQIEVTITNTYALKFGLEEFSEGQVTKPLSVSMAKLQLADAKAFKASAELVMWVEILTPYIVNSYWRDKPTISFPRDFRHYHHAFPARIKCAFVRGGNVTLKLKE